ncbi:MAG: 1-(5-phosphoribosyl)-5-[Synergistaceae bacterium]|nr:1-(5-phosphoribosyl)-5-[(5-phosphoribosylamino)methylideneamino] imidazole-4-carboxamide isomerase [Synergistaceae bacterium]
MLIFPAIDLFQAKAVRLVHGDYNQMTIYDSEPLNTAKKFEASG